MSCESRLISVTESTMFKELQNLAQTAAGPDGLPSWYLKLAAPFFSVPIAHLFNVSLQQGWVPRQWKEATITPIPKAAQPAKCSDFRPISLTPILSRALERLIIRQYVYPILQDPDVSVDFADQFAFRPTGTATATIATFLNNLSSISQEQLYLHLIALDFSLGKAKHGSICYINGEDGCTAVA